VYASFRPFTATSMWLPVKWRHFRSPEVTSRHFLSLYYLLLQATAFRKWIVQYMPVFGNLQPLPGDFRSNDVTSGSLPVTRGHVTWFPVTCLPSPASYSLVGSEMYNICQVRPSPASSRWLPFKWCHFRVTSGNLRSRDVISCHVTASSCELQPCRMWNVQYIPVSVLYSHFQVPSGQMTSLPGHFW